MYFWWLLFLSKAEDVLQSFYLSKLEYSVCTKVYDLTEK